MWLTARNLSSISVHGAPPFPPRRERLVADDARGDSEWPLRWTAESVRALAGALGEQGHEIHFTSVSKHLR
jgi:Rhodopirellula transposase DDE domain